MTSCNEVIWKDTARQHHLQAVDPHYNYIMRLKLGLLCVWYNTCIQKKSLLDPALNFST